MVMKPKLDRWCIFGNTLVGYMFDSRQFPAGTRVQTEPVRYIDPSGSYAECLDGHYSLGDPGTQEEHNQPLMGK